MGGFSRGLAQKVAWVQQTLATTGSEERSGAWSLLGDDSTVVLYHGIGLAPIGRDRLLRAPGVSELPLTVLSGAGGAIGVTRAKLR